MAIRLSGFAVYIYVYNA